jgi:hypothetical protein
MKPTKDMKPSIEVGDVIELTQDCEVGTAGERGVVTHSEGRYMTIVFPQRASSLRTVHTGADYKFVRINPLMKAVP